MDAFEKWWGTRNKNKPSDAVLTETSHEEAFRAGMRAAANIVQLERDNHPHTESFADGCAAP